MDLKAVISTVAPWIASAISGPLGGMAISTVADVFGLSDKTEEAIKTAISGATPEQMLALKQADQQFALKMQELGFQNQKDLTALEVQDRDSARNREVQTKDSTPKVLAYIITGFFVITTAEVLLGYAKVDTVLAGTLIGYMSAKADQILSYYFGSTKGSADKTKALADAVNK